MTTPQKRGILPSSFSSPSTPPSAPSLLPQDLRILPPLSPSSLGSNLHWQYKDSKLPGSRKSTSGCRSGTGNQPGEASTPSLTFPLVMSHILEGGGPKFYDSISPPSSSNLDPWVHEGNLHSSSSSFSPGRCGPVDQAILGGSSAARNVFGRRDILLSPVSGSLLARAPSTDPSQTSESPELFTTTVLQPTGRKLHSCSKCNYSTYDLFKMKVHIRTHTNVKPFACSYCPYRSTQMGNLKTHMRKHTGETPFSCPLCAKGFSLHKSLHSHLMHYHNNEQNTMCPFCKKKDKIFPE